MKWLYTIILLFSINAMAQDDSARYLKYQNQYGMKMPRIAGDSVLHIPYRDTNFIPFRPGAIVMRPADKRFYIYENSWVALVPEKVNDYMFEFTSADCHDTTFTNSAGVAIGNYSIKSLPQFIGYRIRVNVAGLGLSDDPRWGYSWYYQWDKVNGILRVYSSGACTESYPGDSYLQIMVQMY